MVTISEVSDIMASAKTFRGSLTEAERKCYTDAVLCLQNLPSLLDPVEVPGAKNRYDGMSFKRNGYT